MNYYEILGVSPKATFKEIRNAYKKLAFQYHPDQNSSNPQAEEIFKKINEAYHVLSDPHKRHFYDVKLGFTEEINYDYYYQEHIRKQQAEQQIRIEILKSIFRYFRDLQKREYEERRQINRVANRWIAMALVLLAIIVVWGVIKENREIEQMYQQAQIALQEYELTKADSLINLIRQKRPKNEKYILLYVELLYKQKFYYDVYSMLSNTSFLENPDFEFYWLMSKHRYQETSPFLTLQALKAVEQRGFQKAILYLEKAMLLKEIQASDRQVCQELHRAVQKGEPKARALYQNICHD